MSTNPFIDLYYGLRTLVTDRREQQQYGAGTLVGSPFNAYGIHRANKYDLSFNLPSMVLQRATTEMTTNITELNKMLSTHCTNVIVPQGNISTTQVRVMGEARSVPYDKIYDTATFTFYMDNNGIVHKLFSIWMSCIFDPNTRLYNYYDDFVSQNIDIRLTNNETVNGSDPIAFKTVRLLEAYPSTIAPIQLTGLTGAQPTQFDVTMVCRRALDIDLLEK